MTEEEQFSAPEAPAAPKRPLSSQAVEIAVWVISPLLLLVGAAIVALVLGAPVERAALVFALLAIGVAVFLLYRPQAWSPFGKMRLGGLIYSGGGALVVMLFLGSVASQPSQVAPIDRAASARPAAAAPAPPQPQQRNFYPWPYTISPLTITCQDSSGADAIVATAADGRAFAVNDSATTSTRPSISTIARSNASHDDVRQTAASLTQAGQSLCQGADRGAATLIVRAGTPPPPPPSPWEYYSTVDEMSDRPNKRACTQSTNEVQLAWPYESQHATLCLRQHPRFGEGVIVHLETGGQFLCTSYEACSVRVRFDDGQVAVYSALEPSDNSSDTIFIVNHARFIAGLRHASRVIIEANFYQAGLQRMSFDADQLQWPPPS